MTIARSVLVVSLLAFPASQPPLLAAEEAKAAPPPAAKKESEGPFQNMKFRNLGPAVGGGRVTAVAGIPGDPNVIYVGGAAGWLDEVPDAELGAYRQLLATLEKRAALLEVLGDSLQPRRPFVRVGGDLAHPAFQDVALVGAAYGLTHQVLGAVSLLGPVRMDYDKAIRTVRGAAFELSRFVEEVYEDN